MSHCIVVIFHCIVDMLVVCHHTVVCNALTSDCKPETSVCNQLTSDCKSDMSDLISAMSCEAHQLAVSRFDTLVVKAFKSD
jgi:hypothetical protein